MATLENIWEEVQNLNDKLDALPGIIEITGNQVKIITLDELSESMGLLKAGEFRSGNGRVPGDSFSGIRIGYPPMSYPSTSTESSDRWNLTGVDADTLQFGIRASDGVAVAGGGSVILDAFGITMGAGQTSLQALKWWDSGVGDQSNPTAILAEIYAYDAATTFGPRHALVVLSETYIDSDIASPTSSDLPSGDLFLQVNAVGTINDSEQNNRMQLGMRVQNDTTTVYLRPFEILLNRRLASSGSTDSEDVATYVMALSTDLSALELEFGQYVGDTNGSMPLDVYFYGLSTGTPYASFLGQADAVIFGAGDTTDLWAGWLGEKALTLASTATAGIEDPDGEMVKLWADTAGEMRLTDSAGEDWYLTKSTSTGGGIGITDVIASSFTVVDTAISGWVVVPGSDTSSLLRTAQFAFSSDQGILLEGYCRVDFSVGSTTILWSLTIYDSDDVLFFRPVTGGFQNLGLLNVFAGQILIDSGVLTVGNSYVAGMEIYSSVSADRTFFLDDRQLTKQELNRTW